jgi:hydrogenase maturation protease
MAAVVAGLGRRDRGDDAAGPAVAGQVRAMRLPGVRVIELASPAGLLEAWAGARLVVVADALRSGQPPGTVQVLHASHQPLPASAGAGSTHDFGLAGVVELARALGRLPADLVIVGVTAARSGFGEPLSGPVAAAIGPAARTVAAILRSAQAQSRNSPAT